MTFHLTLTLLKFAETFKTKILIYPLLKKMVTKSEDTWDAKVEVSMEVKIILTHMFLACDCTATDVRRFCKKIISLNKWNQNCSTVHSATSNSLSSRVVML